MSVIWFAARPSSKKPDDVRQLDLTVVPTTQASYVGHQHGERSVINRSRLSQGLSWQVIEAGNAYLSRAFVHEMDDSMPCGGRRTDGSVFRVTASALIGR